MGRVAASLQVRVVEAGLWMRNVRLRMPFHYGSARMAAAPVCYLRLTVEDTFGRHGWGVAAATLVPAWFDKRPGRSMRQDVDDLLAAAQLARAAYLAQPAATPFALWQATYEPILAAGEQHDLPPLAAGWGAALYERALIDAAARLAAQPATELIRANRLGVDLGSFHADLQAIEPAEVLPARPLNTLFVRHTVGLSDPLTDACLPADERLNDGLPQTLEDVLRAYAVSFFKIKICGDVEADLERLSAIARVLDRLAAPYHVTLDGNEQYRSWEELLRLVAAMKERPALRRLVEAVLFVEQPLHRERALDREGAAARARIAAWRPLLIDESDDTLAAWPLAAELGYRGVSFKSCKGFYKGLRNQALAAIWTRAAKGDFFISGEDLTTLPLVALQQDLALAATLGIEHVERNGHHYVHGLDLLTSEEQEQALGDHPDLYTAGAGFARLRIEDGRLRIGSLLRQPGLAVAREPPWPALTRQDVWQWEGA